MTTMETNAEPGGAAAGGGLSRASCGGSPPRGRSDAALLVGRVGREIADLAAMADDIQRTVGSHVGVAALADPALMRQAQTLDLLTQSLRGLASFLAGIGHRGIGHEALDFEGAASAIEVRQLADRLAGRSAARSAAAPSDDVELF